MGNRSMFVGMDVHKETIDISVAEGGRQGEVRHYGVIATDLEALDKVMRALRAPNRVLHLVYEAGPCGFGIHRHLTARGDDCVVVSPSMVPKRSGDRVKTDRRDSGMLARLHRAGELRAIHIPDGSDEAMRDLVRAREDAVVVATQATYRLKAFLLRQGRRSAGHAGWTLPYRRWLAGLSFSSPAQHIALQEYRDAIDETERRIERLTEQLRQLAPTWRWAPLVAALQALRGVSFITAIGLVAELGDLTRFGTHEGGQEVARGDREEARPGQGPLHPGPQDRTRGVLHAVARHRVFDGEVPRGVAGRERVSQTSNSSHVTELAEIAPHACAAKRPEPSIMRHRSGSERV